MFPSGTDRTHVTAAVSCGVLIPTRFVWPYGGRRVYLLGSFTRWTEHLPMSLVEGCPSIFQAICSLTPGVHQYKFFVDGEWRHDERQPHMVGNYGIVNTLIVTQEPSMQTILSPETPNNRMNMDVDHENFRPVVSLQLSHNDEGEPVQYCFHMLIHVPSFAYKCKQIPINVNLDLFLWNALACITIFVLSICLVLYISGHTYD
ncbi:hypothetical protein BHE74_00037120 [Ensete ventricosum]|nr:hypothetical protein BHE74_00037120 [Ensete ventricosum]